MTVERRKILTIYGAKLVLSPGRKGMDGAEDLAREFLQKDPERYFMPNQFANRYNPLAHYETMAEEIWNDTRGRITHFVAGIGTSGTLMGASKRLRKHNPSVRIIAVEPVAETPIQGLKNLDTQYVPPIFDESVIDERHYVTLDAAEETARLLARREGVFCGPSSGGILHVAMRRAKEMDSAVMVAVAPDGGEKYLSTELCNEKKCHECFRKFGIS